MQGGAIVVQKDGYLDKLHLTCTREIIVSITADITTANVPDNKMYIPLTSVFSLPSLHYMMADPGYDAKKLDGYSKRSGIDLVCPVGRYEIFQKN